jgi:NTE family protein
MAYDRLDDINFPRHGQLASLEWSGQRAGLGSDQTADRVALNWIAARTFGRQTAVLWTSLGTALNEPTADLRTLFPLGGFLNLSGIKSNSISGPHFGISRLLLYRQVGRGGPGFLDVPAYIGFSLEAGNVWQRRSDASFNGTRKDASLFLGLDTPIGPVYLGTGFEEGGARRSTCFSAGRSDLRLLRVPPARGTVLPYSAASCQSPRLSESFSTF